MSESPPREEAPPSQHSSPQKPPQSPPPSTDSVEEKKNSSRTKSEEKPGQPKDRRDRSDRRDHRDQDEQHDKNSRERGRPERDDRDRYPRRRSRSSRNSSRRYSRSRSPPSSRSRGRSWKEGKRRSRSYSSHSSSVERRRRKKRNYSSSRSRSSSSSPHQTKKEKVSKFSDTKAPSSLTPGASPLQNLDPNALAALQQQQQLALRLVLAGNANQNAAASAPFLSSSSSSLYPSSQNPLTTSSLFPLPSAASSPFPLGLAATAATATPTPHFPLASLASPFFVGEPKENKELFIGNTPSGVTEMVILEFLNAAMRHTGLYSGPENFEPIVSCRLNSKFAFIEMRTAHDATNAMNLNNIPFLGNLLKIGRPSKYHGPVTPNVTWQELISGPGYNKLKPMEPSRSSVPGGEAQTGISSSLTSSASHSSVASPSAVVPAAASSSSSSLAAVLAHATAAAAAATLSGHLPAPPPPDASTKTFREIFVGNTSLEMNSENLKEFMANAMEKMGLLTAPGNPILQVRVNPRFSFIEMRSIEEASNCLNLNGIPFLGQSLKLSRPAKYAGALVTHFTWDDILSRWMTGELKILTSGPSSRVLMLTNMIQIEDLTHDETYQEIIQETKDEISNYGHLKSIVIPRPSHSSSSVIGLKHKGIGKVFLEMSTEEEAKSVLIALKGRTFDGRIVDVKFFPLEKFVIEDYSDPPAVILTANGCIDLDTVLGNKTAAMMMSGNGQTVITMDTPTAAQLSSYAHLNLPLRSAASVPTASATASSLSATTGMLSLENSSLLCHLPLDPFLLSFSCDDLHCE
jgi:hypothetical protein